MARAKNRLPAMLLKRGKTRPLHLSRTKPVQFNEGPRREMAGAFFFYSQGLKKIQNIKPEL